MVTKLSPNIVQKNTTLLIIKLNATFPVALFDVTPISTTS